MHKEIKTFIMTYLPKFRIWRKNNWEYKIKTKGIIMRKSQHVLLKNILNGITLLNQPNFRYIKILGGMELHFRNNELYFLSLFNSDLQNCIFLCFLTRLATHSPLSLLTSKPSTFMQVQACKLSITIQIKYNKHDSVLKP
jgi:hypothetical protein